MGLTDTHAHFDSSPEINAAMVAHALAAGVGRLLAIGGSETLNCTALSAARAFPDQVRLALGLDRDQATSQPDLAAFERLIEAESPCAIGEIGLDYHYHPESAAAQRDLFAAMLRLADKRRLPVIVHTREADEDTLSVLDEAASVEMAKDGRLGVIHCFTGSRALADEAIRRGLYISFSGIVTFANAAPLREIARDLPAERLLIETDTPYLTPVPKRGQRNEPALLTHVAACVAKARGISVAALARLTTENAERLFGAWACSVSDRQ